MSSLKIKEKQYSLTVQAFQIYLPICWLTNYACCLILLETQGSKADSRLFNVCVPQNAYGDLV